MSAIDHILEASDNYAAALERLTTETERIRVEGVISGLAIAAGIIEEMVDGA